MSKWGDFSRSARRLAGKAVSKTGDITDTASLHVKLARKEASLGDLYEQFGRVAYQKMKVGSNVDHKMKILMEKIDVVRAEIYSLKKAIEDKRVLRDIELHNAREVENAVHNAELKAQKHD
jgi:hypothetical protein